MSVSLAYGRFPPPVIAKARHKERPRTLKKVLSTLFAYLVLDSAGLEMWRSICEASGYHGDEFRRGGRLASDAVSGSYGPGGEGNALASSGAGTLTRQAIEREALKLSYGK
ncbi:hypothetical protein E4U43_001580 [Claviceps pusilla]|uniref:Uncharacterized protein n=1 Tax=Claviceps pusilla TaxID=123648 RepID=A0A9P7N7V0_9HYPO|nr:hypothetical protein E4U43_001580 [Claviceps pusilla]